MVSSLKKTAFCDTIPSKSCSREACPYPEPEETDAMRDLTLSEKTLIGVSGAIATFVGVLSGDLRQAFVLLGLLAAMSSIGYMIEFASRSRHGESSSRRNARSIVNFLLAFLSVVILANGVEIIYLNTADSYPKWMTSRQLGNLHVSDVFAIGKEECTGPVRIIRKSNGVILRCGVFKFVPGSRTMFAESVKE